MPTFTVYAHISEIGTRTKYGVIAKTSKEAIRVASRTLRAKAPRTSIVTFTVAEDRRFDVVGRRKEFVNADGSYNEAMIAEAALTQPEAYVRAHAEIAFNHHPANVEAAFAGLTPSIIRSCKTDGAIR